MSWAYMPSSLWPKCPSVLSIVELGDPSNDERMWWHVTQPGVLALLGLEDPGKTRGLLDPKEFQTYK